jgi:hypothetical protein
MKRESEISGMPGTTCHRSKLPKDSWFSKLKLECCTLPKISAYLREATGNNKPSFDTALQLRYFIT